MTTDASGHTTMLGTLKNSIRHRFHQLGVLRSTLVGFTILSILLATPADQPIMYEGWAFVMTVVNPALMPLWLSGLWLDALMSKAFMADAEGAERDRLRFIIRVELVLSVILILAWTPFFMSIMS